MLLFVLKTSISGGLVLCGYCFAWIALTPRVLSTPRGPANRLVVTAFLGGSVLILMASCLVLYP